MKLFKSVHEFNYEWSLVSAANWQKYPNENCPHVRHVDVLNRWVDPETGILTTERLITVEQNVPSLIRKILGGGTTQYVREISIIEPKDKILTMKSINLTMNNLLSVEETIVYREHPEHKQKTQFTQQAAITAGSLVSRWGNVIEEFSLKRFQQNAAVGREGFNKVLERFVVMAEAQHHQSAGSPTTNVAK
ncbi:PRELI-like family-domain-containing protein [Radiomyces spectabilis]|uniref:PRELI-like family-domain-containing protein n=1 Tax=Radiomyces spectabilis TaxID=64574 RepID=UPI00221E737D|nr:PRELI-like family-domain-containing protein [Radiomyces spectabilis]KAI8384629.1 PRELI-like family-domain-containing protein [Radiomyces spectabilis]